MEELRLEKQRQEEQRRQAQLEKEQEQEQEKTENNRKAETDRRAEVPNLPRTHARTLSPASCLLRCATGLFPSSLSLASGLDGRRAALPLVGSRGRAHDADVPHHRHHLPHGRHISRLPPVRGLTTFIITIVTIFFTIITSASNRLTCRRHASAIISVSSLAAAAYPWSNGNAPQFSSGGASASSPASGKDFYRREMDQRLYSKMV